MRPSLGEEADLQKIQTVHEEDLNNSPGTSTTQTVKGVLDDVLPEAKPREIYSVIVPQSARDIDKVVF